MVLTAARNDTVTSRTALEKLCQAYWHPVYHYIRRRGYGTEDAQDLTQSFFTKLLERQALAKADPERGKFRSFLLGSVKNFLADEWDKSQAQKRGGGRLLPLDFSTEESRLPQEPVDSLTPEKAYERRWALSLLDQVYHGLANEFATENKAQQFAALRITLTAPRGAVTYEKLAKELNMTEGAVKVAVHRLRRRYRQLLRAAIAETVSSAEEIDEELRYLMQVLST